MTQSTQREAPIRSLFAAIDAMDTAAFVERLTPGAEFRFGSAPAVYGSASIGDAVEAFFATIAGLRHEVTRLIAEGDVLVCEGAVTYTRVDGSDVTFPFANIFVFDGELIDSYRVYVDAAALYAESA